MPAYTNMAWPGDPYGTGQLWRKEPRLLVGLAMKSGEHATLAFAITYLRLSRTPPVDLSPGVSFGFRAAVAAAPDEHEHLVQLFDLEVLRARRLAKILAGYHLDDELSAMRAVSQQQGRGIQGLSDDRNSQNGDRPGLARVYDLAREEDYAAVDLATVAEGHSITVTTGQPVTELSAKGLAVAATERALVCALVAGRALGQYIWEGSRDIETVMAAHAWDCFDSPESLDRQH